MLPVTACYRSRRVTGHRGPLAVHKYPARNRAGCRLGNRIHKLDATDFLVWRDTFSSERLDLIRRSLAFQYDKRLGDLAGGGLERVHGQALATGPCAAVWNGDIRIMRQRAVVRQSRGMDIGAPV